MTSYYAFTPRHNSEFATYVCGSHFAAHYRYLDKLSTPTVVALVERQMKNTADVWGPDYFDYPGVLPNDDRIIWIDGSDL